MPSMSSEPGDHPLTNLLLCSSDFSDEQHLSFLVCWSHYFIVDLLLLYTMNDPSCVLSSNFLGDELMGYTSNTKVMSSWVLGFLPYHAK